MIDIHHHLLPGFDDGAQDLDTSIAMARIAAEDGITHVVCTPHANNQYVYDLPAIEGRIEELQRRLDAEGVARVRFSPDVREYPAGQERAGALQREWTRLPAGGDS